MQKSFSFKNKQLQVKKGVYEPREDSFLLTENMIGVKGKKVLDIGCGSGIQGINALMQGSKQVVFSDKNKTALKNAKQNAKKFGFKNFKTVQSDLFENINEKFDTIIFNPPYVESHDFKFLDLDGGKKGREVLDKFLMQAKKRLTKNGEIFFLQSSLNGEKKTKTLLKKLGFRFEVLARKKLFFEELIVFKAWV